MNSNQPTNSIGPLRGLSWKQLVAGLFTFIAFGFLVAALVTNWQQLRGYEWQITPVYLALGLVMYLGSLLLAGFTWHRLIASTDRRVQRRKNIKFFLQSNLAKRVPGLVWYALGRLYLYEREGVAKSLVAMALTLELVTMIAGTALLYFASFWSVPSAIPSLRPWWLVLPVAVLIAIMAWPKSLYTLVNWLLERRGHAPLERQARRRDLLEWSFLHAGSALAGGLCIVFLAAGVYPELTRLDVVPVINSWAGAALVAYAVLFLPLGLGVKEVTLAYLLSQFLPWPVAVVISLLGRICSILGDGIGLALASRL